MASSAAAAYGARLRVQGRVPKVMLVPLVFLRNLLRGAFGLGADMVAPAVVDVFRLSDGDEGCPRALVEVLLCDASDGGACPEQEVQPERFHCVGLQRRGFMSNQVTHGIDRVRHRRLRVPYRLAAARCKAGGGR